DNSNLVLRCEIDTAALAEKPKSEEVFNEGGFTWTVATKKVNEWSWMFNEHSCTSFCEFALNCGVNHSGPWNCNAGVVVNMRRVDGTKLKIANQRMEFCESRRFLNLGRVDWNNLMDPL
ncbi:hypothetical protein PMAYCL1PPCAC_25454, partial [Pristionchus mayeri]